MADVFLSYKSEDRDLVATLAHALEREGVSVWWDKKIAAGGVWRETIAGALGQAKVVIVAWSKRTEVSTDAAWVFNEVDEAQRMKLPIVPVQLEACNIPLGYRHVQAANLTGWRGDPNNPEWHEVRDAVRAAIAGKPVGGAATARRAPAPASERKKGGMGAVLLAALVIAIAAGGYYAWSIYGAPQALEVHAAETPLVAPVAATATTPPETPPAPPTELEMRTFGHAAFSPPADRETPIMISAAGIDEIAFGDGANTLGAFRHGQGDQWAEYNAAGEKTFEFARMETRNNVLWLHDPSRDVWLQLDLPMRRVMYRQGQQGNFELLYFIVAVDGRPV